MSFLLFIYLALKTLYNTGTIINESSVENNNPPIMAHPIGAHISPPLRVSGQRPPIVVTVVRTMGTNLVFPAEMIASIRSIPPSRC